MMASLMNKHISRSSKIIALVFAFAAGLGFTLQSTVSAQASDEAAVRDTLLQNAAAFERGDMTALNKLWANDESVSVFESGHANYGWADYRDKHLKPEMAEMKNTKYSITDIEARIAGNTAWATFKYTISANLKDRRAEGGGLGTAILEKRDGRWVIVHWHSSSPRSAPAAKSPHKH